MEIKRINLMDSLDASVHTSFGPPVSSHFGVISQRRLPPFPPPACPGFLRLSRMPMALRVLSVNDPALHGNRCTTGRTVLVTEPLLASPCGEVGRKGVVSLPPPPSSGRQT